MAVAFVQSWRTSGANVTASSNTLTVSGATANNLLVAVVVIRTNVSSATFTTPSGWTLISDAAGNGVASATYYRIASGTSADNFAASWSVSKRWAMAAAEYSGLAVSSVLETSAENEAQLSSTTGTISTGSASPTTAGLAVAFLGGDWGSSSVDAETFISINSSFTKRVTSATVSDLHAYVSIADLDLSDTSAVNPTWTNSLGAGAGQYAAIAVFKEAGGGTTITADGVAVDDVTVSSSAESSVAGSGSVSVDAVKVSSVAAVEASAEASITLDGATLSSEAAVDADASAEIALDAVAVESAASVAAAALDASADIQIADASVSALASALSEAQSTIALDGATISSEVVTEAREASVEIALDGFTISSVIGDRVQTGGGGSSSRPKRPTDWNPTPYERKGLEKISEAARKRRLIEAARVEDEFLLEAVQKLLVEAA